MSCSFSRALRVSESAALRQVVSLRPRPGAIDRPDHDLRPIPTRPLTPVPDQRRGPPHPRPYSPRFPSPGPVSSDACPPPSNGVSRIRPERTLSTSRSPFTSGRGSFTAISALPRPTVQFPTELCFLYTPTAASVRAIYDDLGKCIIDDARCGVVSNRLPVVHTLLRAIRFGVPHSSGPGPATLVPNQLVEQRRQPHVVDVLDLLFSKTGPLLSMFRTHPLAE